MSNNGLVFLVFGTKIVTSATRINSIPKNLGLNFRRHYSIKFFACKYFLCYNNAEIEFCLTSKYEVS